MTTSFRVGMAVLGLGPTLVLLGAALLPASASLAQATAPASGAEPIAKGQRVFTCGHSFHVFVPPILADMCAKAGISGHTQVGLSSIGGSRVIEHWTVPDDNNKAKEALRSASVDVLTLSPIFLPDAGLDHFTALAVEHNKNIRILVQPIWLRWDIYEPTTQRPEKLDRNAIAIGELRKRHEPLFKSIDDYVSSQNKRLGRTVLFVVPAPQAVLALRERIVAGQAPGLKLQSDLFGDDVGHGKAPLMTLVAYCNYAAMYRRSPVGLPVPEALTQANLGDQVQALNRLLQELAWAAAVEHPLSGVRP